MLKRQAILVAEDEPYIAINLALAIEDAGGLVIGPAASVEEALDLLDRTEINGAILDVNLADGDITPVVIALAERGVPTILQTGIGLPPGLAAKFPALAVHIKPCSPAHLINELSKLVV